MIIYPLDRMDPGSWALIPGVVNRVAMFCRKHETDTDPESISQRVVEHFVVPEKRQTLRVWVAVRDGVSRETRQEREHGARPLPPLVVADDLIGHCLVTIDTWCDKIIATIVQYESDEPLERAQVRRAFDEIAAWSRSKGATTLRILTLHKDERGLARARLFQRLYGFRPTHMVCDREL